jgi:hypothetical protein
VTRAELGDRWAGVIYSDEKCEVLYKIRAPPLTPSRRLGDQSSGASSSPSVHMLRIPSRGRSVPRCATHSASERRMRTLTSRCGRGLALLTVQCPPPRAPCVGRHREGLQLPAVSRGDSVGDDCRDNESDESDHDPGADGDNKRKRAKFLDQTTTTTTKGASAGRQPA